jgi:hypothetical protein
VESETPNHKESGAALQIQKVYKGHTVRSKYKKQKGSATTIQKVYRGHTVRKQVSY